MANQFRRTKPKNIDNTGFSNNSSAEGGRLTNKDGSINLRKTGVPFWERISLYHTLLRIPRWRFFFFILLFYTAVNVIFALMYVIAGVENLHGIAGDANDMLNGFEQAFFFSSQTLTTVGYGHISPVGLSTNIIAAFESFIGLISFAFVTGLLYGRFSRPKAFLKFSENLIIAPHKGYKACMIRLASYKNNHITDVEAQMTMAMHVEENGRQITRFFAPKLEISRIASLALSWTIVHLIDEDSPLYNMSYEDIKKADVEILYQIKGFDDHFSNIVQQRTSYTIEEIVYGAKFTPMFHRSEDGATTILELDKVNAFEYVDLPLTEESYIN